MKLKDWCGLIRTNRERLLDDDGVAVITIDRTKLVTLCDYVNALERAALYVSGQHGMMTPAANQMIREALAQADKELGE